MTSIVIIILAIPALFSASLFFGIRPYIHRHGKPCITAARWSFSALADWSEAWEIGKQEGGLPACVKWFLVLLLAQALLVAGLIAQAFAG